MVIEQKKTYAKYILKHFNIYIYYRYTELYVSLNICNVLFGKKIVFHIIGANT